MPLLFMDANTVCELSSPCGSLSAEEYSSSNSALDREEKGNQPWPRRTKKREKNRDAARKSRRKQTERADELHEELQCLEQSNSALQKEIAALKKNLRLYEKALERHKPHCRLKHAECEAGSRPPQASGLSSLNTGVGLKPYATPERTVLTPSACSPITTGPAAAASSAKIVTSSSSSLTSPYSVSFSTNVAPHSLFFKSPLTSCPSFVSSAADQRLTNTNSSASKSPSFADDEFLRALDSSFSSSMDSYSSHLALLNTGLPKQGSPRNVPEFSSCRFNPPAPQTPSLPARPTAVPSPAAASVPSIQSYNQQVSPVPKSLLSMLTVPSPLIHPLTSPSSSNSPTPNPSRDMSLSELLEVNDWILNGFGNQ